MTVDTEKLSIVHIGAGSLGLGYVVPSIHSEVYSTVANRQSPGAHHSVLLRVRKYELRAPGGSTSCRFDEYMQTATDNGSTREFIDAVARANVVSTSIGGSNYPATAARLADAIASKPAVKEPLYIMCFENKLESSRSMVDLIQQVRPSIARPLIPCDVIVDRICRRPEVERGKVVLATGDEKSCYVLVPDDAAVQVIERVFDTWAANMTLTRDDVLLKLHARRKFWCINAVDYAAATFAHAHEFSYIGQALCDKDDTVRRLVWGVAVECAAALTLSVGDDASRYPEFSWAENYASAKAMIERLSIPESTRDCYTVFKDLFGYSAAYNQYHQFTSKLSDAHKATCPQRGKDFSETVNGDAFRQAVEREAQTLFEKLSLYDYFDKVHARLAEPVLHLQAASKPQLAAIPSKWRSELTSGFGFPRYLPQLLAEHVKIIRDELTAAGTELAGVYC